LPEGNGLDRSENGREHEFPAAICLRAAEQAAWGSSGSGNEYGGVWVFVCDHVVSMKNPFHSE